MKIRFLNDNSFTTTIHILLLLARTIYVLQYTSMHIPIKRNYNIIVKIQSYQFMYNYYSTFREINDSTVARPVIENLNSSVVQTFHTRLLNVVHSSSI